jgi:hypothetical protein
MAKDDYQVLVVYILAYLYDCLKSGKQPNPDELNDVFFQINQKYYEYVIRTMVERDLIRGVKLIKVLGGTIVGDLESAEITPQGIELLFDDSIMKKAKKALKGITDVAEIVGIFTGVK